MPNSNRFERIGEEYKKEISNIINYKLKNPNVTGLISVTKVKVTNDLKYAKVYVSILNSKNLKETLAGLKKSSGFIRSELARSVNLRNTPEIIFELDDSIEYGARIDSILDKIMKDAKQQKKEERKNSGTSSFEDMIAYVDENGLSRNLVGIRI